MTSADLNETKEREHLADKQEEMDNRPEGEAVAETADTSPQATATQTKATDEDTAAQAETQDGDAAAQAAEVQEGEAAEASPDSESAQKIEELTRQAEEHYNRMLRIQADFDNFRRRTQREKEELAKYASMKLIEQLLPVLDNFERAMQVGQDGGEENSFFVGMEMIHRQLMQVMEAEGLRKMEPVGTPFDPEMHQAVVREESEEHEEGIVIDVIQNGYWLKDKVLRPAMVKVSG